LEIQRKKRNLSQTQVAALVGTVAATVSNWEAGKTEPRPTQILILCGQWDLEPLDLIGSADTDIKAELMQ
jgi:transcriptional regulator with XRE-family HTH domain